jgi:hypothetical protein
LALFYNIAAGNRSIFDPTPKYGEQQHRLVNNNTFFNLSNSRRRQCVIGGLPSSLSINGPEGPVHHTPGSPETGDSKIFGTFVKGVLGRNFVCELEAL